MKSILILGVGGTGSRAANLLQKKIDRTGRQEDVKIVTVVFDTNAADEKNIDSASVISLSENATVGMVRNRLGKQCDSWFPASHKYDENNLSIGAGQWRKQSYLAFLNAMNDGIRRNELDNALQRLADQTQASFSIEVYTIASLAGGTGSGTFIPLTLYVKKRLRQMFPNATVRAKAMLACPDIYESKQNGDRMNITSIYANAYAILRELNGINQVVYGMNGAEYDGGKGESARRGRTPVNFRLGSEDSPVGVLFDSTDKKYHSPASAPFERVCLMEKIVNVSSVAAHDEALANSLYAMICTKAGGELDGIWSNEEKKRAGETGHNCMYAGIGSSEIQYPVDILLDYFAWRKTRDDAEGAWLTLHNATEEEIREKRKLAKQMHKEYHLSNMEYAKLFLDMQKAEERTETGTVTELIHRATRYYEEKDGKIVTRELFDKYWEMLQRELLGRIPDKTTAKNELASLTPIGRVGLFASSEVRHGKARGVAALAEEVYDILNEFYRDAVDSVRSQSGVCADAVLPLDIKKDPCANLALSFVNNVLMRDGAYIHPVPALVQLCRFRLAIGDKLNALKGSVWKDVGALSIGNLPFDMLRCDEENGGQGDSARRSAYVLAGDERLAHILADEGQKEYLSKKSDYSVDSAALKIDGVSILDRLHNEAGQMLLRRVLTLAADRVDGLIECYRSFFRRFDEQKVRLGDRVKRAELDHSSSHDTSCIYVGASVESRRRHYDRLMEESLSESGEKQSNDVAGKSVFAVSYNMACAKSFKGESDIKLDTTGVFDSMYASNRMLLAKTDYYQELKKKNVFEVLAEENPGAENESGKKSMITAYEMAKPALRVFENGMQKEQAVVLVPREMEEYLESNSTTFGLSIGGGDAHACADDLLGKWCPKALVRIEDSVPSNTLFVCRALMSVDSIDIIKVNEENLEDGYYKYYLETVKMAGPDFSKCGDGSGYADDSKLPHLGFNWHKRGYLPFINHRLEAEADVKMVKALLYAIMNGELTFSVHYGDRAFRYAGEKIVGDGKFVDENNLRGLISWLRPQDDKIEKWSEAFDHDVEQQLEVLPPTGFVHQIPAAKQALTSTAYLKQMRRNLFDNITKNATGSAQSTLEKKLNMNIFEFAFRIKNEEEAKGGYDCNDGEKILRVVSDLLWTLCERVVSSDKDEFHEVYQWELDYFVAELYEDDDMPEANRLDVVREMMHFANRADSFMEIIPSTTPGSKWEKRAFDIARFMEERSDAIARVRANKASERARAAAKEKKAEAAASGEPSAESAAIGN